MAVSQNQRGEVLLLCPETQFNFNLTAFNFFNLDNEKEKRSENSKLRPFYFFTLIFWLTDFNPQAQV
jgi:hypothetical protein